MAPNSQCRYRMPGVGMIAINDAIMIESSIYVLLKKHFKSLPCYVDLLEAFHEITFRTEIGQLSDLLTAPEDKVNLHSFSMEKYRFIVIYKTAYYSFYLPVALSMHLVGLGQEKNLQAAREILLALGEYFQIQNDYLDNHGNVDTTVKIGTDIQDNKCSWLIIQALSRASPAQRQILEANFARKDKNIEAKVKAVSEELKTDDIYREYKDKRIAEIRSMIAQVDKSSGLKKAVFESFLKKIYKRSK